MAFYIYPASPTWDLEELHETLLCWLNPLPTTTLKPWRIVVVIIVIFSTTCQSINPSRWDERLQLVGVSGWPDVQDCISVWYQSNVSDWRSNPFIMNQFKFSYWCGRLGFHQVMDHHLPINPTSITNQLWRLGFASSDAYGLSTL